MAELATVNGAPARRSERTLSGEEKGLLFLLSLDEKLATQVLEHLSEEEVKALKRTSDAVQEVEPSVVIDIYKEFVKRVREGVPASLKGSNAYLRRLAGKALGEGKVAGMWEDRVEVVGLGAELSQLDVKTLLGLLSAESPQTVAILLAQVEPSKAAEVLERFDEGKQVDVMTRMARLETVREDVMQAIEEELGGELAALGTVAKKEFDGPKVAANLLKKVNAERAAELVDQLGEIDEETASELRKAMFSFEDLVRIDGRGMQSLLKEVDSDQLVRALKNASEIIRDKILGNMSSRAAAMLQEELELSGPMKVTEVEEAQQAIVEVALSLEKEGKIMIVRDGGEGYV